MVGLAVQVRAQGHTGWFADPGAAVNRGLTGTEARVLALLSRGYTATRIARTLLISPRTVHKHLEHIYRKLGVSDRLLAVQVANELELCEHTNGTHANGMNGGSTNASGKATTSCQGLVLPQARAHVQD